MVRVDWSACELCRVDVSAAMVMSTRCSHFVPFWKVGVLHAEGKVRKEHLKKRKEARGDDGHGGAPAR